jgi:hypothetical protein
MKLESVIRGAAQRLPGEVGQQLLGLLNPTALAIMLGVITVWVGAHFFGAGEIADIILLTLGWLALGGVVLQAGEHLFKFATITLDARAASDLDAAAVHLASAIALLGVQTVLAILLKGRPQNTFKTPYSRQPGFSYSQMGTLPSSPGPFCRPKILFTRAKEIGKGGTNPIGDTNIGRRHYGQVSDELVKELEVAAYHEAVHRFLTPKLQVFRGFRVYFKQSGNRRSYILRYLEEALAETYGQIRARGFGRDQILKGLKFPLGTYYELTIMKLGQEAAGIFMGPITVGGMLFNVFESERTETYDQTD